MNRLARGGRGKKSWEPIPWSLHNRGDSYAQAMAQVAACRRLGCYQIARGALVAARRIRLDEFRLIVGGHGYARIEESAA